jgi:hypothetical protein
VGCAPRSPGLHLSPPQSTCSGAAAARRPVPPHPGGRSGCRAAPGAIGAECRNCRSISAKRHETSRPFAGRGHLFRTPSSVPCRRRGRHRAHFRRRPQSGAQGRAEGLGDGEVLAERDIRLLVGRHRHGDARATLSVRAAAAASFSTAAISLLACGPRRNSSSSSLVSDLKKSSFERPDGLRTFASVSSGR